MKVKQLEDKNKFLETEKYTVSLFNEQKLFFSASEKTACFARLIRFSLDLFLFKTNETIKDLYTKIIWLIKEFEELNDQKQVASLLIFI